MRIDIYLVLRYRNFWQSRVFQAQNGSQEECIECVAVVVEEAEGDGDGPGEFPLNNTESLPIRSPATLDDLINKILHLDFHFLQRGCLVCEFG